MTIVVNEKTRELFPASVRRKAGIKIGDELEVKVSGGIITMLPKFPSAAPPAILGTLMEHNAQAPH